MAWALAGGEEFMSVPILETLTSIFVFGEAFKHYTLFSRVPYSLSYQNSTIGLNVAIEPTSGCLVTEQSPCLLRCDTREANLVLRKPNYDKSR